jgi:acetyl-CoA C-acetyltransferase
MLGGLSRLQAPALRGAAIRAALDRAGITGEQVDAVIMGNVVQAGVARTLPDWRPSRAACR